MCGRRAGARTARLLNRLAQPMLEIGTFPAAGGGTQFDLPLAPLAPGEYYLLFTGSIPRRLTSIAVTQSRTYLLQILEPTPPAVIEPIIN